MEKILQGKVAVITGAAQGIGAQTARVLAEAGASVVIADIADDLGAQTAVNLRGSNLPVIYHHTDITQPDAVEGLVNTAVQRFGRLDIWVNNAKSRNEYFPLADLPLENWNTMLAVCLTGPYLGAKYAIPAMLKNGGGVVINISSVHAILAYPLEAAYDVAKAGLLALTRSIAADYGARGIRSVTILPGAIPNNPPGSPPPEWAQNVQPYYPVGHVGQADDIAQAVLYLASDAARFVTGTSLVVDGGMSALSPEYNAQKRMLDKR